MESDPRALRRKDSQETIISMFHLDPRPMDDGSIYEKELPPLPDDALESSTASTSSLGLSGSRRGPIYYLTRIQRYSSYTFSFFAGLHLANTSLFPLIYQSVPYSEPFLLLTRELYQTPLTEPLLVGLPVAAHVASGLAVRLLRRRQNIQRYGGATPGLRALTDSSSSSTSPPSSSSTLSIRHSAWPPLTYVSASGYAFVGLLASHVGINRVLPVLAEGDSSIIGLQFVSHGFARHGPAAVPWLAYALLLGVGVGHMVWGAAKWQGLAPPVDWWRTTVDKRLRRSRRRAWWGIHAVAALVAGLWAAGGLGIVARAGPAEGWLGGVYDGIYGSIGPLLSRTFSLSQD
ncbi:DUF1691-domain-containing protein [Xylariaceae sp. FL0662B]|nr:DUF1691-domain-containing protein [Xylariaceae sp. FL0662B]